MAYNPFNIFRRNQKAIFAVVTVFIMFTFVLSSGLGGGADFFDWFPRWLGGGRKGDAVCTIAGSKVYDPDLATLRRQRVLANRYMSLAAGVTSQSLAEYYSQQVTPEGSKKFDGLLGGLGANEDPVKVLQSMADDPKLPTGDQNAARALLARIALDSARQGGDPMHYFNSAPNHTTRDLIDFLLWQKKADQLGITLSADDVKALIEKEFFNQFKGDPQVRQAMGREMAEGRISPEALFKAIGAEFRVRLAQTALLGVGGRPPNHTLTAPPIALPPYDQFEFYKDQCSGTAYKLLAVPAAAFVGQVKEEPTEDDLRKLYTKYQGELPDPRRETPGFRDPRRLKVGWLEATGEEKYYQEAAKAAVAKAEPTAIVGALFVVPVGGVGATWAAPVAMPLAVKVKHGTLGANDPFQDLVSAGAYENAVLRQYHMRARPGFFAPLDTIKARAHTAGAEVLALALPAGGIPGWVAPAFPLITEAPDAADVRARVAAGAPALLALDPTLTGLLSAAGADLWQKHRLPPPLPLAAVRAELVKKAVEREARDIRTKDLQKFKADTDKLATDPKKPSKAEREKEAHAAIDKFIQERGLKSGGSAAPHGEYTIGDDPGLAPLKELADTPVHGSLPAPFGGQFFWVENPRARSKDATRDNYKPDFYPNAPTELTTGKVFLAWRTEDLPSRNVPFNEARPRVVEAWKLAEARKLAKKEADRIADEFRKGKPTHEFQVLQMLNQARTDLLVSVAAKADPKALTRIATFPQQSFSTGSFDPAEGLLNVAPRPIMSFGQSGMGQMSMLQTYTLRPLADLRYPTAAMQKELLDKRTEPVGTPLVLEDQPKDTYYVAVVIRRDLKTPEDFKRQAFAPAAGPRGRSVGDQLKQFEQQETFRAARDTVLALLKKEFRYEETEEQAKKLDRPETASGD